jgi:Cyclin
MIEVTIAFSTKQTFFSSVKLMDKFFYMADKVLEAENLHIIGLTAMFISSKVCDVKPVRLKDLVSKIGMFKYSKNEIIEYEQILLKTVDFNVNLVTVLDFLLIFSQKFKTSMIFLYNCEVVCYYSQMNYKMLGFYEDEIALGVMFYVATRLNKEKIARDVICEGNNDKIYAISIETANWISDVNNFINSQRLSKFLKSEIINEPKAIFKFSDCKLEFEHQK